MENIVLRMTYRGSSVDVKIEDTDKSVLLDVIVEMYEAAEAAGMNLPKHPSLSYKFKKKCVKLLDDKGLMEMFSRMGSTKQIDIIIGQDPTPSTVLMLARKLSEADTEDVGANVEGSEDSEGSDDVVDVAGDNVDVVEIGDDVDGGVGVIEVEGNVKTNVDVVEVGGNVHGIDRGGGVFREKLPIRRNVKPKPQPQPKTQPMSSPRRSVRLNEVCGTSSSQPLPQPQLLSSPKSLPKSQSQPLPQHQSQPLSQLEGQVISPRRSPRLLRSTSTQPLTQPSFQPLTTDASTQQSSRLTNVTPRFKMPKATAKKRGLYVRRVEKTTADDGGSHRRVTRGVRIEYEREEDGEYESDFSYEPSDDEVHDDVDELTDLEEEDNIIMSTLDCIDDGYDPYKEMGWISDDEGGYASKLLSNGELYEDADIGCIRLKPWMLFMDKHHFKDALRDFCIQEGFFVVVEKADKKRYTADCATASCEWRIHASVLPDGKTWAIKSIRNEEHGCLGVTNHNPMATSEWAAKKLMEDIRANHDISAKSMNDLLMERYGLNMKKTSLYKGKEIALKAINGGHDDSYKNLPTYCEMIKKTNPGSVANCAWSVMDTPTKALQFKSIFISFASQFKGLIEGCRSLIGVDGTHLKGNHGGVLLAAVAVDGNNEIFPVAVSVVDSENKDSWSHFFWYLKEVLKDSGRDDWTIISDRQKGVEPALESMWPEASRRYCARHLCKNFKKDYPGILMHKLFWRVVNACSEFTFKKAMELLEKHGGIGCPQWFLSLGDKELWTKHKFDPKISSDENTSNFVESFNSTLGVHRCNPVLSLLEGIRRMTMVRHATRQQIALGWPDEGVCPNIVARIKKLTRDSKTCIAHASAKGEYEVQEGRSHLPVSLNKRTCACGEWQISGIPCKHAIKAILFANRDPNNFVNDWFSVERYKAAYGLCILPIPDHEQWPSFDLPTLEPPPMKRSIGRPSRNRRREPGEQRKGKRSVTIKCKKCGNFGHNSKTCKGGLTARERTEIEGRTTNKRTRASTSTSQPQSLDDIETDMVGTVDELIMGTANEANSVKGKKKIKN